MICYYSEDIVNNMPCVLALGNFDGVHTGHAFLLEKAREYAKQQNLKFGIYTFEINPKISSGDGKTRLLSNNAQKIELFKSIGADFLYFEDFLKVKGLDKDEFIKYICDKFKVQVVFCGENFKYAKNASGNCNTLKTDLEALSKSAFVIPLLFSGGESVSSSRIRKLVENGDIEQANKLLGYKFSIYGKILHGNFIGHKIGFPTVNVKIEDNMVQPKYAVYASEIFIRNKKYYGVTNIGKKPTVSKDDKEIFAETNIFDFDGDIYGESIKISLYSLLREEKRFSSLDELKNAIEKDVSFAKNYFGVDKK